MTSRIFAGRQASPGRTACCIRHAAGQSKTIVAYRAFGADELVLYRYAGDPYQVDTVAGVLGLI